MTLSKSTAKQRKSKPKKPYPTFPLFPHASGQWAKKIKGHRYYFGRWDDADAALQRYEHERTSLERGIVPMRSADGCTLEDACYEFLSSKKSRLEAGDLSRRHYNDLVRVCQDVCQHFGKSTLLADLTPEHFRTYRAKLARINKSPVGLTNNLTQRRQILKFAFENGLIDRPVRMGTEFKGPTKRKIRAARLENGSRDFDNETVRLLIDNVGQPLKAMILLAINGGLGNTDVASVRQDMIKDGWLRMARSKTGKDRLIPLWPETLTAICEAAKERPEPATSQYADLLFLTAAGNPWEYDARPGALSQTFRKLLQRLGIYRRGLSFYSLRHTFRTVAEECDTHAADAIMGHDDGHIRNTYIQRQFEPRLRATVDHVRRWLLGRTNDR